MPHYRLRPHRVLLEGEGVREDRAWRRLDRSAELRQRVRDWSRGTCDRVAPPNGDPATPAILLEHHIDLTARASLGGVTLDTALDDPELTPAGRAMLMSLRDSVQVSTGPSDDGEES